jgi:acetyltransferase-like isoleucine patch superfamily enzyme
VITFGGHRSRGVRISGQYVKQVLVDGRDYHWAAVQRIERRRHALLLAYYAKRATLAAMYWGVSLGEGCSFYGPLLFNRTRHSRITVGMDCVFRSAYWSNPIGLNRPCMLSTLKPEAELLIGQGCGLSGTVISAAESVILGREVRCGANVTITDSDWHSPECPGEGPATAPHAPVVIEDGAWLGLNVVVLKGVTIGRGSVVAAGSVVVDSVPPRVVAAGQPARVVRELDPAEEHRADEGDGHTRQAAVQ